MRLSAEDLTCVRGGRTVFSGIDFAVAKGEALVVTGPNGAGKSSLLRQIAGLLRVASGAIRLQGGDPERSIGEQAHYLGHQDALKPSLTVAENLDFWAAYLGGSGAAGALQKLGLAKLASLPAGYLSAGQRRRLALARLVAIRRRIWLLDEPANNLDVGAQARLTALMNAHLRGGGIVVAAAHQPIGLRRARTLRLGPA